MRLRVKSTKTELGKHPVALRVREGFSVVDSPIRILTTQPVLIDSISHKKKHSPHTPPYARQEKSFGGIRSSRRARARATLREIVHFTIPVLLLFIALPLFAAFEAHVVDVTAEVAMVSRPEASPAGGKYYVSLINVQLTDTDPDAESIHYTLDNTDPTCDSTTYTSPLSLSLSTTTFTVLRAVACDAEGHQSLPLLEEYIDPPPPTSSSSNTNSSPAIGVDLTPNSSFANSPDSLTIMPEPESSASSSEATTPEASSSANENGETTDVSSNESTSTVTTTESQPPSDVAPGDAPSPQSGEGESQSSTSQEPTPVAPETPPPAPAPESPPPPAVSDTTTPPPPAPDTTSPATQ